MILAALGGLSQIISPQSSAVTLGHRGLPRIICGQADSSFWSYNAHYHLGHQAYARLLILPKTSVMASSDVYSKRNYFSAGNAKYKFLLVFNNLPKASASNCMCRAARKHIIRRSQVSAHMVQMHSSTPQSPIGANFTSSFHVNSLIPIDSQINDKICPHSQGRIGLHAALLGGRQHAQVQALLPCILQVMLQLACFLWQLPNQQAW